MMRAPVCACVCMCTLCGGYVPRVLNMHFRKSPKSQVSYFLFDFIDVISGGSMIF